MPKRKTQRSKTALTFTNIECIDSPASNDDRPEKILGATSGPDSPVSEQESSPHCKTLQKVKRKAGPRRRTLI